ncbi:hypothetical protein [Pararhizobium sp. PWRC1-1]|uniref:hypothetical protein n=1 Tax=Pararhizobium sp. PWRC1-1 TaxID=2804566 RepID=UPI003CEE3AC3
MLQTEIIPFFAVKLPMARKLICPPAWWINTSIRSLRRRCRCSDVDHLPVHGERGANAEVSMKLPAILAANYVGEGNVVVENIGSEHRKRIIDAIGVPMAE